MKKIMMVVVAIVCCMAKADFTFDQLYSAAETVASNKLSNASAEAKKEAAKAMETAREMKEAYKISGFGGFTASNANHVVINRYARGKRIYVEKPWFGASSERKAVAKAANDLMLKGIETEKDNNVKLELLLEYKLEKFDL